MITDTSVWHRPDVSILTTTSPEPGSGFGTSWSSSGLPKSVDDGGFHDCHDGPPRTLTSIDE